MLAVRTWAENRRIFIELTDQRIIALPASRFRRLASRGEKDLTPSRPARSIRRESDDPALIGVTANPTAQRMMG